MTFSELVLATIREANPTDEFDWAHDSEVINDASHTVVNRLMNDEAELLTMAAEARRLYPDHRAGEGIPICAGLYDDAETTAEGESWDESEAYGLPGLINHLYDLVYTIVFGMWLQASDED